MPGTDIKIAPETAKMIGGVSKGLGVLNDMFGTKEYGQTVYNEAKRKGLSDADAEQAAHQAMMSNLAWYKLPERAIQSVTGFGGLAAGAGLDYLLEGDIQDYFRRQAIDGVIRDTENWKNFSPPSKEAYYGRTR